MGTPPVALTSPAVGDPATAGWADQAALNMNFLAGPPGALIYQSAAAQSLPNGTGTAITLDAVAYDNDSMTAFTANALTINTAGYYLFIASIGFTNNATGYRDTIIIVPSGAGRANVAASPTTNHTVVQCHSICYCPSGSTISLQGQQSSGAALNTVNGITYTWLAALRVSS